MKKHKALTPLALTLPGLLATCAYGGYSNASNPHTSGIDWRSNVTASTGYTQAAYSGDAIALYELISGWTTVNPNSCSLFTKTLVNNVSTVTLTYTWDSDSYSTGECNLSTVDYDQYPGVGDGADAVVWNGTETRCIQ